MKFIKRKLSGIAIVLAILLSLVPSTALAYNVYSEEGTISCGTLYAQNGTYLTARNSVTGTLSAAYSGYIGQMTGFYVWRTYLYFDTSTIPSNAIISAGTLKLWGTTDISDADFNISIIRGITTAYPTDPLVSADFDITKYAATVGGALSTASFVTGAYNTITLNASGYNFINKGAQTKLCIASGSDLASAPPAGNEHIIVNITTVGRMPTLTVNYTVGGEYNVFITSAKVYQGYQAATSGMTITNDSGVITGSPKTLILGDNTPTVTSAGTFDVYVPDGAAANVTTSGWTVTGSPLTLYSSGNGLPANTITVEGGGAGNITIKFFSDYLFVLEIQNSYAGFFPTDNPEKRFTIQLRDTTNTNILAVSTLKQWGLRPESIYVGSAVATTLTEDSTYYLRVQNMSTGLAASDDYHLAATDWEGTDLTKLDAWCIGVATDMEGKDNQIYLNTLTDKTTVLSDKAGGYFNKGILQLSDVRPNLFNTSSIKPSFTQGTDQNTWDKTDADPAGWRSYVGTNISGMIDVTATPFGISGKNMAAGLIMLGMLLCVFWVVSNGAGALGAVLIYVPMLWLGTYFRILPSSIVVIMAILFGLMWIRQFITKTT